MYYLTFKPRARKIFKKLDKKTQKFIGESLDELTKNPFTKTNVKKLKKKGGMYRLRISRWRIIYILFTIDKIIEVQDIFMRKEKDDYEKRLHTVLFL